MRAAADVRPRAIEEMAVRSLPRRPLRWPGRVLVVLAIALVAVGAAGVTDRTDLLPGIVTATVVLVALLIAFGDRTWRRGRAIDKTIEAVNAVVRSSAPTRDLVAPSRWKGGWIGAPTRFKIRYPADLVDQDPKFLETLTVQVSGRMDQPYRISKNDSRRCIVTLDLVTDPAEQEKDEVRERLTSVLNSEIPNASITDLVHDDDGVVKRIDFRWPATSTARASKPFIQKQITAAVRAALDNPTLTSVFDLAQDRATIAPITPLASQIPNPPRNEDKPWLVTFGRFRSGADCVWDLDAPLPHLLIVGGTGGGKSVLLLTLLTKLPISVSQRERFRSSLRQALDELGIEQHPIERYDGGCEIYPIDPKRLGLYDLDLIPGAHQAATREAGITEYLLTVKQRMDERYEFLEQHGPHLRKVLAPLVLMIDEGEEMADLLNEWWQSGEGKEHWCARFGLEKAPPGSKHPVMRTLGSILRLGREARVHVILASQQAASSWLSTSSRSQFAVRIALRNLEASTSMMTFGTLAATEGLEPLPGRAWVAIGNGSAPEHAQIFWTPKLEKGLKPADRQILHGLDIKLRDDEDFVPPVRDQQNEPDETAELPAPGAGPVFVDTDPESERGAPEGLQSFDLSVGELEPGMRILVDVDGGAVPATVDSIDVDEENDDYVRISYTTDEGEERLSSVPYSDQVAILVPAG